MGGGLGGLEGFYGVWGKVQGFGGVALTFLFLLLLRRRRRLLLLCGRWWGG